MTTTQSPIGAHVRLSRVSRALRASLAVLLTLFLCGQALAAPPKPKLSASATGLTITQGRQSASLSLTADGRLRMTVKARGARPKPLPSSLELPAMEGIKAKKSLSAWNLGPWSFTVDKGAVLFSRDAKPLYRMALEGDAGAEIRVSWAADRFFHGMGQSAKSLVLNGQSYRIYNKARYGDQTYLYIPFFFNDSGDAFYLNASGGDEVSFIGDQTALLSSLSGRLDLYLWSEPDPTALVSDFYRLSGSRSLLPRWAYGYIQSKYGYRNEAEVKAVVGEFLTRGIPLDALVLDLYWFRRMGDLSWNRAAFPDPEGLDAWLEERGVKLLAISEPYFTSDSRLYPALAEAGALAVNSSGKPLAWREWWCFDSPSGSIVNPSHPGAQEILGKAYRDMDASGIDGFWIDLGEPEFVPAQAAFGQWNEKEYHQFLNLDWARIVSEAASEGNKRPFILSRSGFTGIAGLGASTWSGDVASSWGSLRAQLPLALNASLSGLPWWGSDVGGFEAGGPLKDAELYLRWQQFGAFTPVHRAHGNNAREPWIFGEDWTARVQPWIELRRRLLPYSYSSAAQVWDSGLPLMRPLFLAEAGNEALRTRSDSYLYGPDILVAPVTEALERQTEKSLYLPPGAWYDISTWERFEGGREITRSLNLDSMPAFIREGALIPLDQGGTDSYIAFPGREITERIIFSDSGDGLEYKDGAGERIRFRLDAGGLSWSGCERERELELKVWTQARRASSKSAQPLLPDAGSFRYYRLHLLPGEGRLDF